MATRRAAGRASPASEVRQGGRGRGLQRQSCRKNGLRTTRKVIRSVVTLWRRDDRGCRSFERSETRLDRGDLPFVRRCLRLVRGDPSVDRSERASDRTDRAIDRDGFVIRRGQTLFDRGGLRFLLAEFVFRGRGFLSLRGEILFDPHEKDSRPLESAFDRGRRHVRRDGMLTSVGASRLGVARGESKGTARARDSIRSGLSSSGHYVNARLAPS